MFAFPPAGTAEKWGCVSKLVLAGLALTFALWSMMALGRGSLTMNLIPVLAISTAGLLVWDAATWKKNKPGSLYLIPYILYKLSLIAELSFSGRPVGIKDYGFPLLLVALMVLSVIDYRRERTDG